MAFTTKNSLLVKVRAGDEISWREFYETYRPLIYLVGRDCGLNAGENEELVQLVMCEIFRKDILAKYNIEESPRTSPSNMIHRVGVFAIFSRPSSATRR